MSRDRTVELTITANNRSARAFDEAQQSLRNVSREMQRTQSSGNALTKKFNEIKGAITGALNPAALSLITVTAGFAAAGVALSKFLKVSEEIQIIENELKTLGLETVVTNERIQQFGTGIGSLEDARLIIKRLTSSSPAIAQFGDKIFELAATFDNLSKVTDFSAANQAQNFSRSLFDSQKPIDLSIKSLTKMSDRLDLFSKAEIRALKALAEMGEGMEANRQIAERLQRQYGDINVEDVGAKFRTLGASTDALWENIGRSVADALGPLTNDLNSFIALINGAINAADAIGEEKIKLDFKTNLSDIDAQIRESTTIALRQGRDWATAFSTGVFDTGASIANFFGIENSVSDNITSKAERSLRAHLKTRAALIKAHKNRIIKNPLNELPVAIAPKFIAPTKTIATQATGIPAVTNIQSDKEVEIFSDNENDKTSILNDQISKRSALAAEALRSFKSVATATTEATLVQALLDDNTAERRLQIELASTDALKSEVEKRFDIEREKIQTIALLENESLKERLKFDNKLTDQQRENIRSIIALREDASTKNITIQQRQSFTERVAFDATESSLQLQSSLYRELGTSISENVIDAVFTAKSGTEALENIAKQMTKSFIVGLVNIGVQQALNFALGESFKVASTASSIASSGSIAAAAAPAAITTSIATAGTSATFGIGAMLAALATGAIAMKALDGQFHAGAANVPKTGSFLLERGERVVKQSENRQLGNFLNQQERTPTNQNKIQNVSISFSATDASGLDKMIDKMATKITRVVSQKQNHNQTRYKRA